MATEGSITTNATYSVDASDDRYLPGYQKGLESFGPRLVETRVAFSLYGTPIPYTLGKRRLQGNIIWSRALEEKEVEYQVGSTIVTNYGYYGTFAVAFGYNGDENAAEYKLNRVWADGRLLIDNTDSGVNTAPGVKYRFYQGTETQLADETIVAYEGAANTPAFRGLMYMVFADLPLLAFDNKIPAITVEVIDSATQAENVVEITATGDTSNSQQQVDWSRGKAYVRNGSTGNNTIYIYNLGDEAYVRSQEVELELGVNDYWIYLPWLRLGFTQTDQLSIYNEYHVFDPETGEVLATAGGNLQSEQCFKISANYYTAPSGDVWTIAAYISQYDKVGFFAIDESGSGLRFLDQLAVSIDASGRGIAVGNHSTFSTAYAYASNGSTAALTRFSIPKGNIESQAGTVSITTEASWYAYDGAGSPTAISHILPYIRQNGDKCLLLFYNNNEAVLINEETKSVYWRNTSITSPPSNAVASHGEIQNADLSAGLFIWDGTGGVLDVLNLETGAYTNYGTTSGFVSGNGIGHSPSRSILSQSLVGGRMRRIYYELGSNEALTITNLIEQVARLSGYNEATEIDVDVNINQSVIGAMLVETTTLEEILNGLRTVYGLEIIESDGQLKITDRARNNTTPDWTITDDDLVQNGLGTPTFSWRQESEQALPKEYKVTYIEPDLGFQWASQVFTRSTTDSIVDSNTTNEIKLPLVMTATEAKRAAARALHTAWTSNTSFTFTLPKEFLGLEPGDIISASVDDYVSRKMRVMEVVYNDDNTMNVTAQSFHPWEDLNVEAYAGTIYAPELPISNEHKVFVFDFLWPNFPTVSGIDSEHFAGVMMLPPTLTASYASPGDLYIGNTAGQVRNVGQLESVAALPWGRITNECSMPFANCYETLDDVSLMNVQFLGGDVSLLSSDTLANVIEADGTNYAAVGRPGAWEILAFADVTLEADGSYTFSNLVRGLEKTHPAMRQWIDVKATSKNVDSIFGDTGARRWNAFKGTGTKGDYFVLIDADFINQIEVGYDELYFGGSDNAADAANQMTFQPVFTRARIPLPCHVTRVTRNSSDVMTVYYEPCYHNQRTLGDGTDPAIELTEQEFDTENIVVSILEPRTYISDIDNGVPGSFDPTSDQFTLKLVPGSSWPYLVNPSGSKTDATLSSQYLKPLFMGAGALGYGFTYKEDGHASSSPLGLNPRYSVNFVKGQTNILAGTTPVTSVNPQYLSLLGSVINLMSAGQNVFRIASPRMEETNAGRNVDQVGESYPGFYDTHTEFVYQENSSRSTYGWTHDSAAQTFTTTGSEWFTKVRQLDRVWVAVFFANGLRKYQLMTVESV